MSQEASEYAAKLKHPRWQRRRLEILQRDNFACRFCGDASTTLHVHHLWYANVDPWEYPDSALLTLCEACHADETAELPDAAAALIRALKRAGATASAFNSLAQLFGENFPPMDCEQWPEFALAIDSLLDSPDLAIELRRRVVEGGR